MYAASGSAFEAMSSVSASGSAWTCWSHFSYSTKMSSAPMPQMTKRPRKFRKGKYSMPMTSL